MITDAHRKGLFCAIFMLALYSILLLPWQVEGKTATAVATETDGFAYENVKAYGAEGDGETDDTQAIRDAISSLPSGGGAVYIPEGRYLVTAPIHVGPGVNLKGEAAENGTGGSILKAGGDMSSIVTTGGWGHQMSIENLTLDGGADQGYSV